MTKESKFWEDFMEVYPHRGMAKRAAVICIDKIIEIVDRYEDALGLSQQSDAPAYYRALKKSLQSPVKPKEGKK